MSYFLSNVPIKTGEIFELAGDEAKHLLLSRRIKIGEMIEIQGPDERRFECRVAAFGKKSLTLEPLREIRPPAESSLEITIFQALIKEQPLDLIIQKSTELGVKTLTLFSSQNSVKRFNDMEKKLMRWKKIGVEAAKQSGRVRPVEIKYLADTREMSNDTKKFEYIFLLEPKSQKGFRDFWDKKFSKVAIVVGPEGGFTEDEVNNFSKLKNETPISMGPRILRAETAAIASAAIIQALWGDM